jgi:hypothetical protein
VLVGNLSWKERSADLFAVANLKCGVHPLPFAGRDKEGISSTDVGQETETKRIEQHPIDMRQHYVPMETDDRPAV